MINRHDKWFHSLFLKVFVGGGGGLNNVNTLCVPSKLVWMDSKRLQVQRNGGSGSHWSAVQGLLAVTLKIAAQFFCTTIHSMVMHHHAKFGHKRLSGSENDLDKAADTDYSSMWRPPPPPPPILKGGGQSLDVRFRFDFIIWFCSEPDSNYIQWFSLRRMLKGPDFFQFQIFFAFQYFLLYYTYVVSIHQYFKIHQNAIERN